MADGRYFLTGVLAEHAAEWWPYVEPLLRRVTDQYDPGYTTDDLLQRVQLRDAQLWVVLSPDSVAAVIITEIQVFPQYKSLHAPYIAGDEMGEWFGHAFEVLESFAQSHGCKYLTGCGRRGWVRYGKGRGYDEGMTIIRKDLTHEQRGRENNDSPTGGPVGRAATLSD